MSLRVPPFRRVPNVVEDRVNRIFKFFGFLACPSQIASAFVVHMVVGEVAMAVVARGGFVRVDVLVAVVVIQTVGARSGR